MQIEQQVNSGSPLKKDFLSWRVVGAKRREAETKRNVAYNLRPRLRTETHH